VGGKSTSWIVRIIINIDMQRVCRFFELREPLPRQIAYWKSRWDNEEAVVMIEAARERWRDGGEGWKMDDNGGKSETQRRLQI